MELRQEDQEDETAKRREVKNSPVLTVLRNLEEEGPSGFPAKSPEPLSPF